MPEPWLLIAGVLLVAGAGLFWWWRRRWEQAEETIAEWRQKALELRQEQQRDQAQAKAQQQALFNSMVEGVLLLDHAGRIQLANQAVKSLMGYEGDLSGQTLLEAFRRHELVELVERAAQESQVRGFELELAGANKRTLQVNAAAIHDDPKREEGVILVFHDLTRLKQLENTRKEFVANVSHELRTPLSLIKGYVETLIDGAKDDPLVAPRFLQTIGKQADRLTYLIEDLLTISQFESGHSVINTQVVQLRPLVDRVLEDLQSRALPREVQLHNSLDAAIRARADADRFQQIMFNLVDNAIKYGRPGGKVLVGGRTREDASVEIFVQDDGPGIPKDSTERIFERFFRVDRARSREQGGTGLGLSIVKHIVQSHGGEVWVKSEPDKGSTFFFTLPAQADAA